MRRKVRICSFNVKVSPILAIQIDFAGHLREQLLMASTVLSAFSFLGLFGMLWKDGVSTYLRRPGFP